MATPSQPNRTPSRPWQYLYRLPFRSRRHTVSQPPTASTPPPPPPPPPPAIASVTATTEGEQQVVVGGHLDDDDHHHHHQQEQQEQDCRGRASHGGPVKRTVRRLIRRATHSFRPGGKGASQAAAASFVVRQDRGGGGGRGGLMGDGESGIVLDDKDLGDCYYAHRVGLFPSPPIT